MEESSGEDSLMLVRGSDLLLLSLYGEVLRICPEHDTPCPGFRRATGEGAVCVRVVVLAHSLLNLLK